MTDFSKPETKELFECEVRKRMEAPSFMSRAQAEMLVAALMWNEPAPSLSTDNVPAAGESK